MEHKRKNSPTLNIFLLILAGEGVFLLPFVLARIFRPSFLEVFSVNNTQLGVCFTFYGIVAMASYLFGGFLADLFPPRKLIALALLMTGLGGFYMATYPSLIGLYFLFSYWGFTTIFLFWAAMIKATRSWGGEARQGRAFGLLEGGRGVVAAAIGSLGVAVFALLLPIDVEGVTDLERQESFRYVILLTSVFVCLIAFAVFFFLQEDSTSLNTDEARFKDLMKVIKLPSVWMLMVIILCAYVGYKITDVFSLFAKDVMQYDEVQASKIGLFLMYIRPAVALTLGFLVGRAKLSYYIIAGFVVVIIGSILFFTGVVAPKLHWLFLLTTFITTVGIYSIRALYFALMAEGNIPLKLTGTAVGLMSLVGFTPDIFVGPIMGVLLDGSPGTQGHLHVFMMLSAFALCGLFFSVLFYFKTRNTSAIDNS